MTARNHPVGYVYRWVNLVNGKSYIGSHDGSDPNYRASGVAIKDAFVKYGIENFERTILYRGPRFREVEEEILQSIDAMRSPNLYNMINSSSGVGSGPDNHQFGKKGPLSPVYGIPWTEERKARMGDVHRGKTISDGMRQRLREAMSGENNHNFGKRMSDEQKREDQPDQNKERQRCREE